MKNLLILFFLTVSFGYQSAFSQYFKKTALSANEKKDGASASYFFRHNFEVSESLVLYKNGRYSYTSSGTNYIVFSYGKYNKHNGYLVLRSDITNTNVPVRLAYLNETDSNYIRQKTIFRIPINLKGQRLSDSRIFINDDSTYFFPFFDTCFNSFQSMNRIKIDFGNGYKTKWIKVNEKFKNQVMIIAQTNFPFDSYLSFNNRKYKIIGTNLKLILEGK